jgi:hypothetical protein
MGRRTGTASNRKNKPSKRCLQKKARFENICDPAKSTVSDL